MIKQLRRYQLSYRQNSWDYQSEIYGSCIHSYPNKNHSWYRASNDKKKFWTKSILIVASS